MIENYKGWDIALTWNDNNVLKFNTDNNDTYKQADNNDTYKQDRKWVGVDLMGHKIYGSSLKEIRHIIDYPNLHNK